MGKGGIKINLQVILESEFFVVIRMICEILLKHKLFLAKVMFFTSVFAIVYSLGLHNYYTCTITLAPEPEKKSNYFNITSPRGRGAFSYLDSYYNTRDAIKPTIYSDVIESVDFRLSLFPIKIKRINDSTEISYSDYLLYEQKSPWWSRMKRSLMGLLSNKIDQNISQLETEVNSFKLTPVQLAIVGSIGGKISCSVDKKTTIIRISVTDQDPLVCALLVDSVKRRLQDYITDYRTSKAHVDLEYYKRLSFQAKAKYEQARDEYTKFSDSNRDVISEKSKQEQEKLESEMQLQFDNYSQILSLLINAEAKVQQEKPAFTTLQSATVPLVKAGPKRAQICIILLIVSLCSAVLWILYRERRLKLIFGVY